MQQVLIDTFIVPEQANAAFLERAESVQAFLKTLPGFVEGYLYAKRMGENRHNYITSAVWATQEALENARKAVAAEFQRQNINPDDFRRRHGIQLERGLYQRVPF